MTYGRWTLVAGLLFAVGCVPAGRGGGSEGDGGEPSDGGTDAGEPSPDQALMADGTAPDGASLDDAEAPPADAAPPDRGPRPDGASPADAEVPPADAAAADVGPRPDACVPADEMCNGVDDDCDGAADEGIPNLGAPCVTGTGACEQRGVFACAAGGDALVCDVPAIAPMMEACNGVDDDCDGRLDEALDPSPCVIDAPGPCADGVARCVDGAFVCRPRLEGQDEVCDGIDDDCDGLVDEMAVDALDGDACFAEGLCRGTAPTCVDAGWRCIYPAGYAQTELRCDGVDEDCDGEIDEDVCDPCLGVACPPGLACLDGACVEEGCEAGQVADEVCNGVDDDCDGLVDEGLLCGTCESPYLVPPAGQMGEFQITEAGVPADVASCGGSWGEHNVHTWVAARNGRATVEYSSDFWPAFLLVRAGGCAAPDLACDSTAEEWPTLRVDFDVRAGETYSILIGHGRYVGPIVLTYSVTIEGP